MKEIITMKMPWKIKHFNKGQTVFIKKVTGSQAYLCRGKFRGRGKWIEAWFKWNDTNSDLVKTKTILVSTIDYDKIMGCT